MRACSTSSCVTRWWNTHADWSVSHGGTLTQLQGKYTSFDDALRTIVNVYLDVLVQVRRKLTSNRIFVHPVSAVMIWDGDTSRSLLAD